ncbi:unnamed protein product [Amoebophrya sp. A25]|nr:unnamed protein product [Amoebophrya sp. A25]|eukprot:GSA25T00012328001.1
MGKEAAGSAGQWFMIAVGVFVVIAAYLASIGFQGRKHVLGIDLGTTFSVVAVKRAGKVEVIPNHETGRYLTPSVVSYVKNGMGDPERKLMKFDHEFKHYLVGDSAVRRRHENVADTIYHSKRFIGKSIFETTSEVAEHPFRVGSPALVHTFEDGIEKLRQQSYGRPGQYFADILENFDKCKVKVRTHNDEGIVTKAHDIKDKCTGSKQGKKSKAASTKEEMGGDATIAATEDDVDGTGALTPSEDEEEQHLTRDARYTKAREVFYEAAKAQFRVLDRWRTPVDIGAAIVKKLKDAAEVFLGYDVYDTVICVPAKFGKLEIQKTYEAFNKAGFSVARVMDEPTAAAVAYGLHKSATGKTVIVYDLGGGTLDASLLSISSKAVNVLGTAGDDHLGGSDFDYAMWKLLQDRCGPSEKITRGEAEDVKKELTSKDIVPICERRTKQVTRDEYETAAATLFERAMAPVHQVLADQMMSADDINHVVLVGGASRMPKIRKMLIDFFGQDKLNMDLDPDLTVAIGAANIDQ